MSDSNIETRKQELRVRLEGIRDSYNQNLNDIRSEVCFNGTEWSVADLLRHVTGAYYPNLRNTKVTTG